MVDNPLNDNYATLCALFKSYLAAALAVLMSTQQHWLSLSSVIRTSMLRMATGSLFVPLVRSIMCAHPV